MKMIAGFEVDNQLAGEIARTVKAAGLGQADTLRQALRFGLPILERRLDPAEAHDGDLAALLQAGLDSGPAAPVDEKYWAGMKAEHSAWLKKRKRK